MQSFERGLYGIGRRVIGARSVAESFSRLPAVESNTASFGRGRALGFQLLAHISNCPKERNFPTFEGLGKCDNLLCQPRTFIISPTVRSIATTASAEKSFDQDECDVAQPQAMKVKRLDKTAKHIMNILDKEAVDKIRAERDIPDVQPGCIVEIKTEPPENKGRVSTIKGLVIARRNAGLSTTFRVRRLESNIGVESVFPLYSPNIKQIKILEKRTVRRAKLYYVRDRPFNAALRELAQRTAKKREMVLKGKKVELANKNK